MTLDQTRQRAERNFKKEERARDGRAAMAEYEIQARAIREKTARLKALRLAKEAQAQTDDPPAKPSKPRPARRDKGQLFELRGSAAAHASNSAPPLTRAGLLSSPPAIVSFPCYNAVRALFREFAHALPPRKGAQSTPSSWKSKVTRASKS